MEKVVTSESVVYVGTVGKILITIYGHKTVRIRCYAMLYLLRHSRRDSTSHDVFHLVKKNIFLFTTLLISWEMEKVVTSESVVYVGTVGKILITIYGHKQCEIRCYAMLYLLRHSRRDSTSHDVFHLVKKKYFFILPHC